MSSSSAVEEKSITIEVPGAASLPALLHLPHDGAPTGAAVVCHPHPAFGGSMYNNVVEAAVRGCAARGLATLRFNYRTTGASEASVGAEAETEDTYAAVEHLSALTQAAERGVTLIGYSFGAVAALKAAPRLKPVGRVLCVAPPVTFMPMGWLGAFDKHKYFIYGSSDPYGREADFKSWYEAVPEPKECVRLDTDHFYIGMEERVAELLGENALND